MADDPNAGGTDNSSTAGLSTAGLSTTDQGTGSTAEPGLNPTGADVQGNDTSKVNEATGQQGHTEAVKERAEERQHATEQAAEERGFKVEGEGRYDALAGRVEHGEVVVTDELGIETTKRAG